MNHEEQNILRKALHQLPLDEPALNLLLTLAFLASNDGKIDGDYAVRVADSPAGKRLIDNYRLVQEFHKAHGGFYLQMSLSAWEIAEHFQINAAIKRMNEHDLDLLFAFERFGVGEFVSRETLQGVLLDESSIKSVNRLARQNLIEEENNCLKITSLGRAFLREARSLIDQLIDSRPQRIDRDADTDILKNRLKEVFKDFANTNKDLPELSPFELPLLK